jgi:YesN/AraC family two-component response regulator
MPGKILIVDDDPDLRSELRDFLEDYEIVEASDGREALKILDRANEIGLVILDVNMPVLSGTDVLREIKKIDPNLGIVIFTGYGSKDVAIEALRGKADDFIEKPLNIHRIKEAIENVLGKKRGETDIQSCDVKGKIERVKQFVQRNCFKKLTLNDAAKAVYLSPKYLSRIFKQYEGKGFNEYKLALKLAQAKILLKKTGYNIDQISDRMGYQNAESFIRQFKKITGYTPTEFRKKIKKKKSHKKAR